MRVNRYENSNADIVNRSMAMGKAVIKRLAEIVSLYYNISLNEGEQKIIEMEKQKKINKELWG